MSALTAEQLQARLLELIGQGQVVEARYDEVTGVIRKVTSNGRSRFYVMRGRREQPVDDLASLFVRSYDGVYRALPYVPDPPAPEPEP